MFISEMILQITYFDRLQREGIENPREIPLTKVWNRKRCKDRLKMEKRGFGKGIVIDRIRVSKATDGEARTKPMDGASRVHVSALITVCNVYKYK